MKKIGFIIMFLFTLLSCRNELKEELTYYSNGNIHRKHKFNSKGELEGQSFEYDNKGNIVKIYIFKKNKPVDSIVEFTNNMVSAIYYIKGANNIFVKKIKDGKLISKGYLKDGKKRGIWTYYKNNKINRKFEFIDLCGIEYANQKWYYNEKGEIIPKSSNNFKILDIEKSYIKNENFIFYVKYNSMWGNKSLSSAIIGTEISDNYCNVKDVKLDSILSKEHIFKFNFILSNTGKTNIRGYIREFGFIDNNFLERKVYFDIPVKIN